MGKSPFLMGKLTISMAIFNSYVTNYQRVVYQLVTWCYLEDHPSGYSLGHPKFRGVPVPPKRWVTSNWGTQAPRPLSSTYAQSPIACTRSAGCPRNAASAPPERNAKTWAPGRFGPGGGDHGFYIIYMCIYKELLVLRICRNSILPPPRKKKVHRIYLIFRRF